MNAHEYIMRKQVQWALNNEIKLIGSKGDRGRRTYTKTLQENLFEDLLPEVKVKINEGDGGELTSKDGQTPKMQAIHSSSALGINMFHYWKRINKAPIIAHACKLCNANNNASEDINFEVKYPISTEFNRSPNVDVVIQNSKQAAFTVYAIECKFSEAYGSYKHSGLKEKYLKIEHIWNGVSALKEFAEGICPNDEQFHYLHPAQLIKHILGLKEEYGKSNFRLLYLWYDVLGEAGYRHRQEIEAFKSRTEYDKVAFSAISYQEVIAHLAHNHRQEHREYISYMTERYL